MSDRFFLEIDHLAFSYQKDIPILNIPAMRFASGRVSILLGGNGTGKTTLLKLLAGILTQDSGTVTVTGRAMERLDQTLYIHQNPYLISGTVEQSMRYLLPNHQNRGLKSMESILAESGLEGFSRKHVHKLSGGEKKRIALACGLSADRSILLLDEPTAHLDHESILRLEGQLQRLREAGRMVIIATHNREFAFRLADTVWQLEGGTPEMLDYTYLRGEITRTDEYFSYFTPAGSTAPLELKVIQSGQGITTAVLDSREVILSLHPIESSARNSLKGDITAIEHEDTLSMITVDCGVLLKAAITRRALESMQLSEGSEVHAVFKSSSVKLF